MILKKLIFFAFLMVFLLNAGFIYAVGLPDPSFVSSQDLSLNSMREREDCYTLSHLTRPVCNRIKNEYYGSLATLKGMIENSSLDIEGVRIWMQRLDAIERDIAQDRVLLPTLEGEPPTTGLFLDAVHGDLVKYKSILKSTLDSATSGDSDNSGDSDKSGGSVNDSTGGDSDKGDSDSIKYPNPLGTDSIIEVIARVLRFIYAIAIPIAVIMIIYVGILFLTAGGNEVQVTKARTTLIWIVVGIAIILIGRGIITLIKDILGIL